MALGGPNIRPGIAGCSYPACKGAGKARRPGTLEEVRLEVADVLIVTAVFAEVH